ncbi:hypothetical protein IWW50_004637 [Coemansia erecta]|nr:hypothetical protein GGF43_003990 [Coemansia sp. RSA 2618]KAJ2821434.1 hypothetical protein IWW50_004637 [Coemansia erecta]
MFTALPFPATDEVLPETVARELQKLDGPLYDTANVRYKLATPQERGRYSACPTCGITFGLFRRKHNCVNCGQVVCSDCLDCKWYLPKYGIKTPVSCCTMCNRNLHLSIKSKPELERCTIRELRAYLTVYGLYDPNKMIEKSDLVAAVYNNSPMPNANERNYRLSLPRPSDSAKSAQRQSQRQQNSSSRPNDGGSGSGSGSWDRMFASIGGDIGRGLESLSQNIERGANAVSEALGPDHPPNYAYSSVGTPPTGGPQTYSHSYSRPQQYPHMESGFFAQPQAPRPSSRPRSSQSNTNFNSARNQGATGNAASGARASDSATAGRNANPHAAHASASAGAGGASEAPAKSSFPDLKDLARDNTDLSTLSIKTLKMLLVTNHVDYSNIVEKQELVLRVQRLVDNFRLEMKTEAAAAAGDSSEQFSEENTCKICLDAVTNCVFLNCGHMCTCLDCGNRILNSGRRECPICREYIAKVVHVFRA